MRFINHALLLALFVLACSGSAAETILTAAGATFPYPLYQKWIELYEKQTGGRISYDGVGSSEGIRRLLRNEVDLGGTDAFLSDDYLAGQSRAILHVPTCLGAVAVTYHLPGHPQLRFPPDVLADIFLGRITNWSNPRLQQANPDLVLPDLKLNLVHRSEGSGTTFIFTDYLCKISPEWQQNVGRGKEVSWPVGLGVEGNPGIANLVSRVPGSIGYVEITYARTHNLPIAAIRNKSGKYLQPSLQSVSAAASIPLPTDTRILITDTSAPLGYPISAFTYLIFYREQCYNDRTSAKACALRKFLLWALSDGQQYTSDLLYAPLPPAVIRQSCKIVDRMCYNGKPLDCR